MTGSENSAANKKFYGLDHLRAFAISFVFLYHYGGIIPHPRWLEYIVKFGWTGVDLFFVLSGYLIASRLFKEIVTGNRISFSTFFLKRFFRIIPAYLAVLGIYFCLPAVREREALAPLWKYLTFTQNIGLDLRTQGTFSHAWSLCIEEQFYLLLPLTLLLLSYFKTIKTGAWLLAGLFLFGFVIRYYSYQYAVLPFEDEEAIWIHWYKAIYYPTWCRLDGLLTGVGIAAMMEFLPLLKQHILKFGNWLLIFGLAILAVAYLLCLDESSFEASVIGFPIISIGYGVMVLGAISPAGFLFKFKSVVTSSLANLSYAVYLTHKFVIHITQLQCIKLNIAEDSTVMLLICICACLLFALLLNKVIEKPFLKLRDKVLYLNNRRALIIVNPKN